MGIEATAVGCHSRRAGEQLPQPFRPVRLWGDDREREMRLVVGSAFVIHQPAESFSGPGRAKEDLEFTAAGGLTAGNRGVHDLDRQILLRNSISAGHPLAYDGTRPWRPGVQSDGRQLSVEAVRPAGRTERP
jgi:hypothetical protein